MSEEVSMPSAPRGRPVWVRRFVRIILVVASGYLGVIVVLLLLENALLFHPTKAGSDWHTPPNSRVQDIQLTTADGIRIHAWWCPQDGAEGAVLYCHGNAGNLSHRAPAVARWQEEMNQNVLIFDYPGYGRSAGKPSEAGCYAAADAAYDWLIQDRKFPADRIILYGGSLGGGVAVELATRRDHRALALCKTFASVPEMAQALYPWLPGRWLVRTQFDNLAKIGKCHRPVFIGHGDCDTLVPFAQGRRLFDAANEPKAFYTMPGCDHNDPTGPEFFAHFREFLTRIESGGN